jgi:hypothetical protein
MQWSRKRWPAHASLHTARAGRGRATPASLGRTKLKQALRQLPNSSRNGIILGLKQRLVVRPIGVADEHRTLYHIGAGQGRWRAAKGDATPLSSIREGPMTEEYRCPQPQSGLRRSVPRRLPTSKRAFATARYLLEFDCLQNANSAQSSVSVASLFVKPSGDRETGSDVRSRARCMSTRLDALTALHVRRRVCV